MANYTCKICNNTFVDEDPFLVEPICPNCKKEKTAASDKIAAPKKTSETVETLLGFLIIFGVILLFWGGCSGVFTYHDKIYVKNKLKTYDTEDFSPGRKNKYIDIVNFGKDDRASIEAFIYNKTTGEEKEISLTLPLYQLRARAETNDFDTIIRYKQPVFNSGNSYIKATDAIVENSNEFTSTVNRAKLEYVRANAKEMKDWVFDKEEIAK